MLLLRPRLQQACKSSSRNVPDFGLGFKSSKFSGFKLACSRFSSHSDAQSGQSGQSGHNLQNSHTTHNGHNAFQYRYALTRDIDDSLLRAEALNPLLRSTLDLPLARKQHLKLQEVLAGIPIKTLQMHSNVAI
mmetsp:Transcript_8792/g.19175  ORF Transcript_8792/g.19175 Transcript_8792/m.19175 type:complete len:133 (+) Transcript_8792:53-451(+)